MKPSFKSYTFAGLKRLQERVQAEIGKRSEKNRENVLRQLQRVAKQHGFDLAALVGAERSGTGSKVPSKRSTRNPRSRGSQRIDKRRKVAAKYRHPQQENLTWTGRGRKPRWVLDWLAAKGTLEQLVI